MEEFFIVLKRNLKVLPYHRNVVTKRKKKKKGLVETQSTFAYCTFLSNSNLNQYYYLTHSKKAVNKLT